MDPTKLLEQFLGSGAGDGLQRAGAIAGQKLGGINLGGFAGGAAAGGLLALLLGNKKVRKSLGGVAGYGGAAALGALAFKAWQNWQQGRDPASAPAAAPADVERTEQRFLPAAQQAADGRPFQLALVQAMIGAAKADGHIDAAEHKMLFDNVGKLGLDADAKAFVFDALGKPSDPAAVAAAAQTQEQAAELYLASRLAIDPDDARERAYLDTLAQRLGLPADLLAHLDRQVAAAQANAAA